IYDESRPIPGEFTIVDPLDPTRRKHIEPGTLAEELLVPVFRRGKLVYKSESLGVIRERVTEQLAMLHPGIKRFVNPHQYEAGLELGLHEVKTNLILKARATIDKKSKRRDRSKNPKTEDRNSKAVRT